MEKIALKFFLAVLKVANGKVEFVNGDLKNLASDDEIKQSIYCIEYSKIEVK
jgi:hypothetical protein